MDSEATGLRANRPYSGRLLRSVRRSDVQEEAAILQSKVNFCFLEIALHTCLLLEECGSLFSCVLQPFLVGGQATGKVYPRNAL